MTLLVTSTSVADTIEHHDMIARVAVPHNPDLQVLFYQFYSSSLNYATIGGDFRGAMLGPWPSEWGPPESYINPAEVRQARAVNLHCSNVDAAGPETWIVWRDA